MFDALAGGIESRVVEAAGWTLVHSVWQGALVAGIVAVVNRVLIRESALSRYLANCCGLLLLLALPAVTFAIGLPDEPARRSVSGHTDRSVGSTAPTANDAAPAQPAAASEAVSRSVLPRLAEFVQERLPWVVALWISGVIVFSLRLLAGWIRVQHLCARAAPVSAAIQASVDALQTRLHLHRIIRVMESARVDVPTLVRWVRPCILLPVGFATGLTVQQINAILLHELVHIRRHDYAINLLQRLVETVLFYHPAAWWISHRVRVEREFACDDHVATLCGPQAYVDALLNLELHRQAPALALSAADCSLLSRARRLAQPDGLSACKRNIAEMTTLPSLLVTLLVVLMTGLASVRPASAVDSIRVALTPSDNTMEFVYIRPGTFLVGSDPQKHPDRREERLSGDRRMWVEITEGFYLGRYEVTQAQWESVMGGAAPHAPSKPQVHISWENTQEFLQILNDAAGEDHFRLPTEAEWEYACRAESGDSDWWFGNYPSDLGDLHSHAFAESHWVSEPQDVTSHPPDGDAENDWGLVHMHGNVWEWVQDWFYFDYDELHRSCNETGTTEADACKDPEVRRDEWSGSPGHVNRGGAFDSGGLRSTRSASRASFYTGNGTFNIGFRVVYTGDPPAFRVDIDIKPGSDHNPVNLKSKGVIPVAILTTESFDASTVDGSSVEFAGASAAHGDGHLEDVDGDGDVDWIGHFKTQDVSIASGDEEAALAGTTVDGMEVEGSDVVDPIGSDRGRGRNKPTGDSTTWGEVKKSVQ